MYHLTIKIKTVLLLLSILCTGSRTFATPINSAGDSTGIKKIKDILIYKDDRFHAAFPSIIKCKNGDFLLAFRRGPERRNYGERGSNHVDANSQLVALRSKDALNWPAEPELIFANPFGGSQDPCLLKLRDGTILCTSYGWNPVKENVLDSLKKPLLYVDGSVFQGGYLLRSATNGIKWDAPILPPHIWPEIQYNIFRKPLPAYNRGALYEANDGRILWAVAATDSLATGKTSTHLLASKDKGLTWQYESQIARDSKVTFNEASVYETPKKDIVVFMRTANFDDQACIARSTDGGKHFEKWQPMGFKGHPLQALRLPDNRVLLVYGYRHAPMGIRARILNAECTDFATSKEFVMRTDGGNGDIGYPWSVQVDKTHVLVTYYLNHHNGTRFIAGSLLEIK